MFRKMVVGNKIKKKKGDRDRERERNEECNIATGKERCFPLSLFLIKIKNNKKNETEKNFFSAHQC